MKWEWVWMGTAIVLAVLTAVSGIIGVVTMSTGLISTAVAFGILGFIALILSALMARTSKQSYSDRGNDRA